MSEDNKNSRIDLYSKFISDQTKQDSLFPHLGQKKLTETVVTESHAFDVMKGNVEKGASEEFLAHSKGGHELYARPDPDDSWHFAGSHPGGKSDTTVEPGSNKAAIHAAVAAQNKHLDSAHHTAIAAAIHKTIKDNSDY